MKLIGHRHSVVGVAVVYNPLERAATVDEAGTVKIWNIDRSQGFRGQHLQSLTTLAQSQINVISFTPILSHGSFPLFYIHLFFQFLFVDDYLLCRWDIGCVS